MAGISTAGIAKELLKDLMSQRNHQLQELRQGSEKWETFWQEEEVAREKYGPPKKEAPDRFSLIPKPQGLKYEAPIFKPNHRQTLSPNLNPKP